MVFGKKGISASLGLAKELVIGGALMGVMVGLLVWEEFVLKPYYRHRYGVEYDSWNH